MRKFLYCIFILLCTSVAYASEGLGIILDEDLIQVGVTPENVKEAKIMVDRVSIKYQMLLLEKKQYELEVNKYVLEGPEENLEKIDAIFEKIGDIETQILKDRVRSQIEMRKYISQEQYLKARDLAIKRLEAEGK